MHRLDTIFHFFDTNFYIILLLYTLASPHFTSPHLPYFTAHHLTSPHLPSPHLTSLHLTFLTSPYLTSPSYLTASHFTSPHPTSCSSATYEVLLKNLVAFHHLEQSVLTYSLSPFHTPMSSTFYFFTVIFYLLLYFTSLHFSQPAFLDKFQLSRPAVHTRKCLWVQQQTWFLPHIQTSIIP